MELAKVIDATDYDILNYLAHSYRMKGDSENADLNFNLIISGFPNTQKAENARQYLSSSSASVEAQNVAGQTENTSGAGEGDTNE